MLAVEDRARHRDEPRVGHPCSVVPRAHLAQLVGAHAIQRRLVRDRIVLDRDLGRHPPHRVHAAAMAGSDQQPDVGVEERPLHRHLRAVGEHEVGTMRESS